MKPIMEIAGLTPGELKAIVDSAIIENSDSPRAWGIGLHYDFLNSCWDLELTRNGYVPLHIPIKDLDTWQTVKRAIQRKIQRIEKQM